MSAEQPSFSPQYAFVCTYGGEIPAMSSADLSSIAFELTELTAGDDSSEGWREAVRTVQRRRALQMSLGATCLQDELNRWHEAESIRLKPGPAPQRPTPAEEEQALMLRRRGWGYRKISEKVGIGWRLVQRICEDNGV